MTHPYKIRSIIIFFIFCFLYFIIIANLIRIQLLQRNFFVQLGEKQYNVTATILPPRAPIYDRNGNLLAMNKDSIAAFVFPKKIQDMNSLKRFLATHFPAALERLKHAEHTYFMYVARRLTPEQIQRIQSDKEAADIHLLNEPSRYYPVHSMGIVTGVTDVDNKGLFGLELLCNEQLAGKPTTFSLEKDARSGLFYFKRRTTVEGKEGVPLRLTIDGNLQFLAYQELKKTVDTYQAQEGSVIIMNPRSGEVYAMVSIPDIDPNNTRALNLDYTKNRIITQEYELGSVIKIFAALAALEEKVVTIDELIDCENVKTTYVDGRRVNTVPSSVAGIIPFYEVIAKSNNIGITKVIKRIGNKLYDHYIRMGFGTKTGIEFPGERSGFVNPPSNWSKQSLLSLSYGYEITETVLQLARGFCIIANNGYPVRPTLILPAPEQPKIGKPLYCPQTITDIRTILEHTVLQGSAKKAQISGYTIMSKTGTSNLLINGQYDPTRNTYTCAGIVEKGTYQRVIVVFIKEANQKNLYASMVAAPLFERVAEKTLIHDKIL